MLLDALEGSSDKYQKAKSHLQGARNLYELFIEDGLFTDELISAALCLAHLEGSRRSGVFNEADLVTLSCPSNGDVLYARELPMADHAEGRASVERCGWIIPGISHTINERVNELERKKRSAFD